MGCFPASGPAEKLAAGRSIAADLGNFVDFPSQQRPTYPSIQLQNTTWEVECTRTDNNGCQRSFRHCAKARSETLAVQLAPDPVPRPLQLRVYDPMARRSRTGYSARAHGGIWTSVSGHGKLHKMDADNGFIGSGALRCWYVLSQIQVLALFRLANVCQLQVSSELLSAQP